MEWNVFYHNVNKQKIETFNIFEHYSFNESVKKILKKCNDKKEFAKELKFELMYYFCSKSEWEIIIFPWCGRLENIDIKVDVYDQVMLNWDVFVDYCWSNKKHKS